MKTKLLIFAFALVAFATQAQTNTKKDLLEKNTEYIEVSQQFSITQNYVTVDYGQEGNGPLSMKNNTFRDESGERFKRIVQLLNYLSDSYEVINVHKSNGKYDKVTYLMKRKA